jgi:hypothetical protein
MNLYLPDSSGLGQTFVAGSVVAIPETHKLVFPYDPLKHHPFGVPLAETPKGFCSICGKLVW